MLLEHDASFTQAEYAATLFLHCPSTLQNELLAGIIAQKTGCRVRCGTQHLIADAIAGGPRRQLVLFDCHDMAADQILSTAASYCPADSRMLLALFNAHPELAPVLEKQAMRRGIRGIFYENQSIDILVKGISAILSGEWWFSRKALGLFFDQIVAEQHAGACSRAALFSFNGNKIITTSSGGMLVSDAKAPIQNAPGARSGEHRVAPSVEAHIPAADVSDRRRSKGERGIVRPRPVPAVRHGHDGRRSCAVVRACCKNA